MEVRCTRCDRVVAEEDVSVAELFATCGHCYTTFDFSDQHTESRQRDTASEQGDADAREQQPRPHKRPPVEFPKGWQLKQLDGAPLDAAFGYRAAPPASAPPWFLSCGWFRPIVHPLMVLLAIGIGCVGWVVFRFVVVIAMRAQFFSWMRVSTAPFVPLIYIATALHMGYEALSGMVNRTFLMVADGQLLVRQGPLPRLVNQSLTKRQVQQLYCQKQVGVLQRLAIFALKKLNFDSLDWAKRRLDKIRLSKSSYRLHAALNGKNRTVILLSGVRERSQALYLQQLIEGTFFSETPPGADSNAAREHSGVDGQPENTTPATTPAA